MGRRGDCSPGKIIHTQYPRTPMQEMLLSLAIVKRERYS